MTVWLMSDGEVSGVTVWLMSDGELTRLEVLRDLDQRRLTIEAAARLLRLERRQVFRLLKAYRTAGPDPYVDNAPDGLGALQVVTGRTLIQAAVEHEITFQIEGIPMITEAPS